MYSAKRKKKSVKGWVDRSAGRLVSQPVDWLTSYPSWLFSLSAIQSVDCWLISRLSGQNGFIRTKTFIQYQIKSSLFPPSLSSFFFLSFFSSFFLLLFPSLPFPSLPFSPFPLPFICQLLSQFADYFCEWGGVAPPHTPSSDGPV